MSEICGDPLLADEQVSRREIQDRITAALGAARGLVTLFQAYRKVRDELEASACASLSVDGKCRPNFEILLQKWRFWISEIKLQSKI